MLSEYQWLVTGPDDAVLSAVAERLRKMGFDPKRTENGLEAVIGSERKQNEKAASHVWQRLHFRLDRGLAELVAYTPIRKKLKDRQRERLRLLAPAVEEATLPTPSGAALERWTWADHGEQQTYRKAKRREKILLVIVSLFLITIVGFIIFAVTSFDTY